MKKKPSCLSDIGRLITLPKERLAWANRATTLARQSSFQIAKTETFTAAPSKLQVKNCL